MIIHIDLRFSWAESWSLQGHRRALLSVLTLVWEHHSKETGEVCPWELEELLREEDNPSAVRAAAVSGTCH